MDSSLPTPAEVLAHASGWIEHTAAGLWPGSPVRPGPHVPSVTAYVRRIEVDGRPLFAKVSVLGVSLVSVLRGACGDWPQVKARQAAYTATPGGLLERETIQYGILHTAGLKAPRIAGYADGVLFTEPVTGPTLADLIVKRPERTADLLAAVTGELEVLGEPDARALATAAAIPERSVAATFGRKFNGLSASSYLALCGPLAPVLERVVARLGRMRPNAAHSARRVIFGDLKPEHALFPDEAGGRPVFLDPGLSLGHPATDMAKLVSRLVLHLIAQPPDGAGVRRVADGIDAYAETVIRRLGPDGRKVWLRQIVTLWLMDTVNILTTYLTSPEGLPLPDHARTVTERAGAVAVLLEETSAALASQEDGRVVWQMALGNVVRAASR
ncbi:phosphotransferase [Streptomyces sp. NPDC048057]|uniref:phosphotransferase n=1 Tax=Streptomyces sp. NPDC048057 TaxID=3155628 RepID=UPI0033D254DE